MVCKNYVTCVVCMQIWWVPLQHSMTRLLRSPPLLQTDDPSRNLQSMKEFLLSWQSWFCNMIFILSLPSAACRWTWLYHSNVICMALKRYTRTSVQHMNSTWNVKAAGDGSTRKQCIRKWEHMQELTSSSLSSKYCSHCKGTTSLKPSRKDLVCSSTPRVKRQFVIKLQTEIHVTFQFPLQTKLLYVSCFSFCFLNTQT